MPSITLEWTLPLTARRPGEFVNKPTGFVAEFDCELTINWWADEDGYDYELDYVAIDDGKNDRFIISSETDAVLWPLMVRGFEYETRRTTFLTERVRECIDEALSDEIYERPSYEDVSMGR
jgi:hypothetical protein